jgi:2-deoxy-D-gluconate 3-dehydrogenase|tara:strand:+ start:1003 stop:1749 length:747 start_codon:yes stop_codon:yes gene_type:complete
VGILKGKQAIITGGSTGIGLGITEGFIQEGASVAVVSRSADIKKINIDNKKENVSVFNIDLADRDSRADLVNEMMSTLGKVDILVNCHGVALPQDSVDHSEEDWDTTIETNLSSTFFLCQTVGKHMISNKYGKIINIASMYAFFGGVKVAAYTASKGGVAQLTKALSNEWSNQGVNVNAIAPGYIRTELNRHVWEKDLKRSQEIIDRTPAGRWGDPEDMAGPAIFLASHLSDFINGVIIPVDGGFAAR